MVPSIPFSVSIIAENLLTFFIIATSHWIDFSNSYFSKSLYQSFLLIYIFQYPLHPFLYHMQLIPSLNDLLQFFVILN